MIKYFILGLNLISIVFTLDVNFSLETKYGDGNKVTGQASETPDITKYNFLENILDINAIFDNGIFVSTQLEYSAPPIFGATVKGLNNFVVDYMDDNYSVKLGNLYTLYGRGLSLNMSQNQNIDYDNSVRGIEFKYTLNDLNLFGIWGKSKFDYRSNPAFIETDLRLENKIFFIGSEYYHDRIGMLQYSVLYEQSKIGIEYIRKYYSGNSDIGKEISDRFPIGLPENINSDLLNTIDHNLAWNYQFRGLDIYIEKVWNTYTKILGDTDLGSKLYLSLNFDIGGMGITYEYKNYDQKYYIPTLSAAPTVFREGNSTLASRNSHTINWGDEVGHQIELNSSIGNFQMMGNFSFAYKHKEQSDETLYPFGFAGYQYPFRQLYSELSGYAVNEKLYFKLGVDLFNEFRGYEKPSIFALTFPSMLTYNLGGGNSITSYIERQIRVQQKIDKDMIISENVDFINNYFSFTFNYLNYLSLSFFYDDEITNKSVWSPQNYPEELCLADGWNWDGSLCSNIEDEKFNEWVGCDISYKINSTSQVSLFYGSQKGGLVCANGVCAEQPGFDDGIKVTLRTIF